MRGCQRLRLGLVFLLWAPLVVAQNNLGELLDAGAAKVSVDEFREAVIQRVLVGPSPAGGSFELIYTDSGLVQGSGNAPQATFRFVQVAQINGQWTVDDNGRICTSLRFTSEGGGAIGGLYLPPRCQIWFKLGDKYFISDSDSDRSAKVLSRTLKQ
jgi:hypothetical protein